MAVYKAAFISTLVCGCEYWTTYRSHIRNLESFHIRCLRRILGLTWADRVAHTTILESTGCLSIECLIISQQLRWIGHVIRMPENRLLRKLFYRELIRGHHIPSSQKKRYRDHLHSILKLFNIPWITCCWSTNLEINLYSWCHIVRGWSHPSSWNAAPASPSTTTTSSGPPLIWLGYHLPTVCEMLCIGVWLAKSYVSSQITLQEQDHHRRTSKKKIFQTQCNLKIMSNKIQLFLMKLYLISWPKDL